MLCRALSGVLKPALLHRTTLCGCASLRHESTLGSTESSTAGDSQKAVGGFAKAFEKHAKIDQVPKADEKQLSFAALLRNSKFIDLGEPEGRLVTGTIFHVVGDDLYIDFGWKFHCVCTRPTKNSSEYVRGSKVRLRLKDLELSTRFLGSDKDLTILEADATLLGLVYSPVRSTGSQAAADN